MKRMTNKLGTQEDARWRCQNIFSILHDLFLCVNAVTVTCPKCHEVIKDLDSHASQRDMHNRPMQVTDIGMLFSLFMSLDTTLAEMRHLLQRTDNDINYKKPIKTFMNTIKQTVLANIQLPVAFQYSYRQCSCGCPADQDVKTEEKVTCYYLLRSDQKNTIASLQEMVDGFLSNNDEDKEYSQAMEVLSSVICPENAREKLSGLHIFVSKLLLCSTEVLVRCPQCDFLVLKGNGFDLIDRNYSDPSCMGKGTMLSQLYRQIDHHLTNPQIKPLHTVFADSLEKLAFYLHEQAGTEYHFKYEKSFCMCHTKDMNADNDLDIGVIKLIPSEFYDEFQQKQANLVRNGYTQFLIRNNRLRDRHFAMLQLTNKKEEGGEEEEKATDFIPEELGGGGGQEQEQVDFFL